MRCWVLVCHRDTETLTLSAPPPDFEVFASLPGWGGVLCEFLDGGELYMLGL